AALKQLKRGHQAMFGRPFFSSRCNVEERVPHFLSSESEQDRTLISLLTLFILLALAGPQRGQSTPPKSQRNRKVVNRGLYLRNRDFSTIWTRKISKNEKFSKELKSLM